MLTQWWSIAPSRAIKKKFGESDRPPSMRQHSDMIEETAWPLSLQLIAVGTKAKPSPSIDLLQK